MKGLCELHSPNNVSPLLFKIQVEQVKCFFFVRVWASMIETLDFLLEEYISLFEAFSCTEM